MKCPHRAESTAWHEAGHVIALWHFGVTCTRAEAGDGDGEVGSIGLGAHPALTRVIVEIAGVFAARRFCRQCWRGGGKTDHENMRAALKDCPSPRQTQARAFVYARNLMREQEPALAIVASELFENHKLDAAALAAVRRLISFG